MILRWFQLLLLLVSLIFTSYMPHALFMTTTTTTTNTIICTATTTTTKLLNFSARFTEVLDCYERKRNLSYSKV